MKHAESYRRFVVLGCVAGLALGACTADLDLALAGKQCDGDGQCVDGYVCNALNVCVLPSQVGAGAGGGPGGGSGGGASTAGAAGTLADGGRGGDAGRGGSGALGGTGGAGEPDRDAGIVGQPVPTDASCGVIVYRDADGDGIGNTDDVTIGCPEPGWVTQQGDCRDDQRDVFPGQTEFFSVPFPAVGAPGDVSFDYDCSRTEDPDDRNLTLEPTPLCDNLLNCTGDGFVPASPPRAGADIDPRCGSVVRRRCVSALVCTKPEETVAPNLAFRCK